MPDFAVWLKNLDPGPDRELKALKDFADANALGWPSGSNEVRDYVSAVNTGTTDTAMRGTLLSALTGAFVQWKMANRSAMSRLSGMGARLGPYLLALFGLLIAGILVYGIFYENFLATMADPSKARGLITFLFSMSTIAIFLLIAIAIFWIEKGQVEERYGKAKDLLTMMIGIFGTILGFYYGSLEGTQTAPAPSANLGNSTTSNLVVIPGEAAAPAAWATGAFPAIDYDLYLIDPSGAVNGANPGSNSEPGEVVVGPATATAAVAEPASPNLTVGSFMVEPPAEGQ